MHKYALVNIEFMKELDLTDVLSVEANSKRLLTDAETLREYFGIEYSNNPGDIISQFSERLGRSVPIKIKNTYSDSEKRAMVYSLSVSDSGDPEKIIAHMYEGTRKGKEGVNLMLIKRNY